MPAYVIMTPAHNEEAFIEKTLDSMIRQTVKPLRWVIVNDGSTDRTGEILARFLSTRVRAECAPDSVSLLKAEPACRSSTALAIMPPRTSNRYFRHFYGYG